MDAKKMGTVIKTLRLKSSLTQKELADRLGITDKAVSKWERGVGTPDISMINKLSAILNIDADNLLDGNIAYLENEWSGVLRLDKFECYFSLEQNIYGKPFVYILLSYFALARIKRVNIICKAEQVLQVKTIVYSCKEFGLEILINPKKNFENKNIMIIEGPIFIYGSNLTKYFQRAMSNTTDQTVLVSFKTTDESAKSNIVWDTQLSNDDKTNYQLPISFVRKSGDTLYYEPIANGMIHFLLKNDDDILEAANLLKLLKVKMGIDAYNLREICDKRKLRENKIV